MKLEPRILEIFVILSSSNTAMNQHLYSVDSCAFLHSLVKCLLGSRTSFGESLGCLDPLHDPVNFIGFIGGLNGEKAGFTDPTSKGWGRDELSIRLASFLP